MWKHSVTYTSGAQSGVFCNMVIELVFKTWEISEVNAMESYQQEPNKYLKINEMNYHIHFLERF